MNSDRLKRAIGISVLFSLLSVSFAFGEIPCKWSDVKRIVAIGDLHGDFETFISMIQDPGISLVDENLNWIGGETHFVQTGDVLDRGPRGRDILDLLIRLEKEAASAGGMVHFLLGNHEEMNITGVALDFPYYVDSEQFYSFLPEDYRKAKDEEFLKELPPEEREWIASHGLDLSPNSKASVFWNRLKSNRGRAGQEARSLYINHFNEVYGPWLLKRNIVIKINDIIFAHGGINKKYSLWELSKINDSYRKELESIRMRQLSSRNPARSFRPRMVYQADSPLWFRELAEKDEKATEKTAIQILENLGARAMVIGHTIAQNEGRSPTVSPSTMSRFDGRVWTIDTGISSYYYGGAPSALICIDGDICLWPPDTVMIPEESPIEPDQESSASPEELESYLKTAQIIQRQSGASGRTDPWTITLDDGKTVRRALFKYIDRQRPDPLLLPDSYKYEIAAYELNKYLGLDIVPPVVEREIEGFPGSLQIFAENSVRESERSSEGPEPPDPDAFHTAMQVVRIFENLVLNTCGELKDTFVHKETWKVVRVDFSESFEPEKNLIRGCEFERITRELYQRLHEWDNEKVAALMAPYLKPNEINALSMRRALIVDRIKNLIKEKGEKAVLFD